MGMASGYKREELNARRREKYNSEKRKQKYRENRVIILQKSQEDKKECPLCKLEYGRKYLSQHLITRHKLDADSAALLCKPCDAKIESAEDETTC